MYRTLILFAALFMFAPCSQAEDLAKILQQADRFRLPDNSMKVDTEVTLWKSGERDRTRRYSVYLKPNRRSLVVFQHASERGQKVLMLDDKFWLIIPSSRRPIRITPMQKLLGDAATGDIATMTWSEDYDGTVNGTAEIDGMTCLRLNLRAIRNGASYQRIDLYVTADDYLPVSADLYVASGKLAKQARFTAETVNGQRQITAMTLLDRIQTQQKTVIHYLSTSMETIPDKYYNPAFLVRNNLLDG